MGVLSHDQIRYTIIFSTRVFSAFLFFLFAINRTLVVTLCFLFIKHICCLLTRKLSFPLAKLWQSFYASEIPILSCKHLLFSFQFVQFFGSKSTKLENNCCDSNWCCENLQNSLWMVQVTYGSRVADSKDTREFRSSSHILSGCRFWSNVCCLPVSNTQSFPHSHAVMYI